MTPPACLRRHPASPLAVLGFPAVLDAKGRFIFAAGNDSIHMYQVDSVTGFREPACSVLDQPFERAFRHRLRRSIRQLHTATHAWPRLLRNCLFPLRRAPFGATCQAPASVVFNIGASAAFTVTVVTSGGAMGAPNAASRR